MNTATLFDWGNYMRSCAMTATCAALSSALSILASPVYAGAVVFDSLDSGSSNTAFADGVDPIMSATFNTGASPLRVDVALLLRGQYGQPGDTYTISLDGGITLSDLLFDPIGGLDYANRSPVDLQGPLIKSFTFAVTSLPNAWTAKRYDEFAGVVLNPDSLYWIGLTVHTANESVIEWRTTADVSGPGVASNYSAWSFTDEGFFLNKGVNPFPFDSALQMEVDAVPEPSSWAMTLVGFGLLASTGMSRGLARTLRRTRRTLLREEGRLVIG